jgi:hypothetical protein
VSPVIVSQRPALLLRPIEQSDSALSRPPPDGSGAEPQRGSVMVRFLWRFDESVVVGYQMRLRPCAGGWGAGASKTSGIRGYNRSMQWGDVPGWVNAATTAVALLAAMVAARAAWHVLRIEQVCEDDRKGTEARAQAERIAAWPSLWEVDDPDDTEPGFVWGAAIRNASDLPAYQVHVQFTPIGGSGGEGTIVIELVPPGSWRLEGGALSPATGGQSLPAREVTDALPRVFQIGLRFMDAAGRTWNRDVRGVLTEDRLGAVPL